jgi:hypothetical protein
MTASGTKLTCRPARRTTHLQERPRQGIVIVPKGFGAPRRMIDFLNRINLIPPVQLSARKYSASHLTQITGLSAVSCSS